MNFYYFRTMYADFLTRIGQLPTTNSSQLLPLSTDDSTNQQANCQTNLSRTEECREKSQVLNNENEDIADRDVSPHSVAAEIEKTPAIPRKKEISQEVRQSRSNTNQNTRKSAEDTTAVVIRKRSSTPKPRTAKKVRQTRSKYSGCKLKVTLQGANRSRARSEGPNEYEIEDVQQYEDDWLDIVPRKLDFALRNQILQTPKRPSKYWRKREEIFLKYKLNSC